MKNYLFVLLAMLTGLSYAQDQLFKKDNSKLEVKIIEINPTEIKYKLFTYQDGPTIIIAKSDVALIIYQNGVHEVINSTPEPAPITSTTMVIYTNDYNRNVRNRNSADSSIFADLVSTKNLISLNILDPLNGSFTLSYIREFAHNYLHIYVPLSAGFATPYFTQATNSLFSGNMYSYNNGTNSYYVSDFKYTSKTYEVGIGLHFQSSGKHAVTHFVGPYVGMAQFTGTYKENGTYTDANGYYNYATFDRSFVMNRLYVMLNNGILFRITKNFNIMMLAGIGYHTDTYIGNNPKGASNVNTFSFPINAYKFGLSFGYRF